MALGSKAETVTEPNLSPSPPTRSKASLQTAGRSEENAVFIGGPRQGGWSVYAQKTLNSLLDFGKVFKIFFLEIYLLMFGRTGSHLLHAGCFWGQRAGSGLPVVCRLLIAVDSL